MRIFIICLVISALTVTVLGQSAQSLNDSLGQALNNKDWPTAEHCIEQLIKLNPDLDDNYYNMACVKSLMGRSDEAIDNLKLLIDRGWTNVGQFENDPDLKPLQQLERYQAMISSLKERLDGYELKGDAQELNVDVPPLMECYAVMLYLGNPNHPVLTNHKEHPYIKKIDQYFADYKDDSLVLALARMYPGDSYQSNLRAHHNLRTLYIYDGLDTSKIIKYPIEIKRELAGMVRAFALKSDFMTFYNDNRPFYKAMADIVKSNFSFGANVIDFFNHNFKDRFSRFNFYFTPLWGGWQHGPSIDHDGYRECFYFGGCLYSYSKEFYYPDQTMQFLALTEFDHASVNPLTDRFYDLLKPNESKLGLLNGNESGGYLNLKATLNEYVTWAFALQYFYEYARDQYPRLKQLVFHMMDERKFTRFESFMQMYETYINNRDTYPRLEDFYPQISAWLSQLS